MARKPVPALRKAKTRGLRFPPMKILYHQALRDCSIAIFFLLFTLGAPAARADVVADGHAVTVSGRIGLDEYEKLSVILATEKISKVVFKNSGGGSFSWGLRIGKLIAEQKLTTVAEGICASACAIAFMGGEVRQFSAEQPDSALMFHPGFEPGQQVPALETKAILLAWLEARTGLASPPDFSAAMNRITKRKGGVYFLAPSHGLALKNGVSVLFCEGSEDKVSQCAGQAAASAQQLRIISASQAR